MSAMNNLGKKFDFMIDASSCAAFVWLALSTISSPHRTQTGGERGTATVALVARVLRKPRWSRPTGNAHC